VILNALIIVNKGLKLDIIVSILYQLIILHGLIASKLIAIVVYLYPPWLIADDARAAISILLLIEVLIAFQTSQLFKRLNVIGHNLPFLFILLKREAFKLDVIYLILVLCRNKHLEVLTVLQVVLAL